MICAWDVGLHSAFGPAEDVRAAPTHDGGDPLDAAAA